MKDYINKIINADCLEVLRAMPDKCVDLVLTDPPYGTQDVAGGYGRRQLHDKGDGMGQTIANDKDLSIVESVFPELVRVVANGWIIMFFSARKTPEFIDATSRELWFGSCVWDKAAPGLGYHIRYAHEDIAVFRIGNPERPPVPLLSVIRQYNSPTHHPHEKPVQVLSKLAEWGCIEGKTVLDPFLGSGTTAVACYRTRRNYIGIEISPEYCKIAEQRIQAEKDKLALFE